MRATLSDGTTLADKLVCVSAGSRNLYVAPRYALEIARALSLTPGYSPVWVRGEQSGVIARFENGARISTLPVTC